MSHTPNPYALGILFTMNLLNYPMYEGTCPAHVKARRRAKNKVAKRSRAINRARS